MFTSAVGKLFLDTYNERYNKNYSPREFFTSVYYPLFFDHNKYLMSAGNNPLENPKISWDEMIQGRAPFETEQMRHKRLERLMENMKCAYPSTKNAIGFASDDITSTTSGQTTNIDFDLNENDAYYSWFGASLGIGVGNHSILFLEKNLLLDVFDGLQHYRSLLNNNPKMKGNQANTWNAIWLSHKYGRSFDEKRPCPNLSAISSADSKTGIISLSTISWTRVLIGISRKFPNPEMMGYVYNIGETNSTIGFIPFYLHHIRRPVDLYEKLFGMSDGGEAENLWGGAHQFRTACQAGMIGIKAMEPQILKKYDLSNQKQYINLKVYLSWLMAILNNQQLWDEASKFAQALIAYLSNNTKISTQRKNNVQELLNSKNKRAFLNAALEFQNDASMNEALTDMVKTVHFMPEDNVTYFVLLIRFIKQQLDYQQQNLNL